MSGVHLDGSANIFGDLLTRGSFTEKLDVFFPRERHQNPHAGVSAMIEEPARGRMINADNVQTCFAHQRQVGMHLFWPADIITIRIRFKRTVRDAFDEKLLFSVEEKLRSGPDSGGSRLCHVEPCSLIPSGVGKLSIHQVQGFVQPSHKATTGQATSRSGSPSPTRLATLFFKATAGVFGSGWQSSARRHGRSSNGAHE